MAFVKYTEFLFSRALQVLGCVSSWKPDYLRSPLIRHNALQSTTASATRQLSTFNRRSNLMTQFEKLKSQHPQYILLFQVGEFYELYGDDASA